MVNTCPIKSIFLKYLILFGLVFIFGCEEAQKQQLTKGLPPQDADALRNGDINGFLQTVGDPPSRSCPACEGNERQRRGTGRFNWSTYQNSKQTTSTSGVVTDHTPYGRVEWFNGTSKSLPGGGGMHNSKGSKFLDGSILDILPYIALSHNDLGLPTRVSHTTDGTHSKNSRHYSGHAIDIDPMPDSKRRAVYNQIVQKLKSTVDPSTGKPIGCGYFVYDEKTHIHVAYRGSSYPGCPGNKIK